VCDLATWNYKGSGEWHVGSRKKEECCSKRGASFLLKSWWGQWCWNKRPVPHPTRGSTYIRWAKSFSVRTIKSKTKIVATKTKRRRTRWRQRQGELKKYSKGWMVHIQSSTCRAWTKHFANLSKNLVQTNVGINQWWWRKGISFGDFIGEQFLCQIQQVDWKWLCFKLFITCRLGMMMVKEEFVWLDGVEHVHTLYSAGWWGHSKARLVGYGAMQWQARANL